MWPFCWELWCWEPWNSWMFEASGCSSQLQMPAGFFLWWVQLICVHFILALSWTIILLGKVMFGWRVQCVHPPLQSCLLFSLSESRENSRSFLNVRSASGCQVGARVDQLVCVVYVFDRILRKWRIASLWCRITSLFVWEIYESTYQVEVVATVESRKGLLRSFLIDTTSTCATWVPLRQSLEFIWWLQLICVLYILECPV